MFGFFAIRRQMYGTSENNQKKIHEMPDFLNESYSMLIKYLVHYIIIS